MKPKLLKVPVQPQQSFSVRFDSLPSFFTEYHFHPEVELVYIHKGTGTQFVGNSLFDFKQGDLTLLGSGLPHLWKCDDNLSGKKAEATVIHFLPSLFGDTFWNLPENNSIKQMLEKAKMGLQFNKKTKQEATILLQEIQQASSSKKIILLLQLLYLLANTSRIKTLTTKKTLGDYSTKTNERMNKVMQYVFDNYLQPIQLKRVAAIANMTEPAFCRYFRASTKKSFTKFIQELRINHACKLLSETDKSISAVCYESGFNNVSNFNRYFKLQMKLTPLAYRQKTQL